MELYSIMENFMFDNKNAIAVIAAEVLENTILERILTNSLPANRQFSIKELKKLTDFNYWSLRNYLNSDLYTIHKEKVDITADKRLLVEASENYCKYLIKKYVYPSKYENDELIYHIAKRTNNSYFTSEENCFINLMYNNLIEIVNDRFIYKFVPKQDLLNFNYVNSFGFNYIARDIFNAILQNKIHVGDNIMSFMTKRYYDKKILSEKLKYASIYDYFFNENAVLRCDLQTNTNLLIKNFLNLCIYDFNDITSKTILLLKLNNRYSFLIADKIFNEFD